MPSRETLPIPVLDVGGTHITAALVDHRRRSIVARSTHREPLVATGSTQDIIATLIRSADRLRAPVGATWAVAMPGPFDYTRGIGRFRGVGKFDALYGINVRRHLLNAVRPPPTDIVFINDAEAFALGEWSAGAAHGHDRAMVITLGTGVGSAFLDEGDIVHERPDVPPEGRVYRLNIDGRPLEETASRRAILARYEALAGAVPAGFDVRDVAQLARHGDPAAMRAVVGPMTALGRALAPWSHRFHASIIVVGGAITESWDIVGPSLRDGLSAGVDDAPSIEVVRARHHTGAALLGAAIHMSRHLG